MIDNEYEDPEDNDSNDGRDCNRSGINSMQCQFCTFNIHVYEAEDGNPYYGQSE